MNIALDFDGVLHNPTEKFPKMGAPVDGALDAVRIMLIQGHHLTIYTCRLGKQERDAIVQQGGPLRQGTHVHKWLEYFGFPDGIPVTHEKPIAHLYIDDRAWRFENDWAHMLDYVLPYVQAEEEGRESPVEEAKRRG